MARVKTYNKVKYGEQFKVRVKRNVSRKHEVIKTLIVLNIIEKYSKNLYWIRVYTEHPVGENKICDVYFENIKTNEIICYEIQKLITNKWIEETKETYENYERIYFKTDWCLIKENQLSDDIKTLDEQIKELII